MKSIFLYICFGLYIIYSLRFKFRLNSIKRKDSEKEARNYTFKTASNWAKNIVKGAGVRVKVTGNENIPKGNCLFVSNHQGNFDPFIMLAYINKPFGFIAKAELMRIPIISMWMKEIHCVFMDRKDIRKSLNAINEGISNLKKGYSMMVFPEGTISKCEKMLEFKKGSFKLALKSGAPIVPVSIDGSFKIFKNNKIRSIVPSDVRLVIDKPIYVDKLDKDQKKNLAHTVQSIIKSNLNRYN